MRQHSTTHTHAIGPGHCVRCKNMEIALCLVPCSLSYSNYRTIELKIMLTLVYGTLLWYMVWYMEHDCTQGPNITEHKQHE